MFSYIPKPSWFARSEPFSSDISLVMPSAARPHVLPCSALTDGTDLMYEIDSYLGDYQGVNASGLDYPGPGRWVLVDVEKQFIIHRAYLRDFLKPGGCYLILSMHNSRLSTDELEVRLKGVNVKVQAVAGVVYNTSYRLEFPSHWMLFVMPHPTSKRIEKENWSAWLEGEIQRLVVEISEDINATGASTDKLPSQNNWGVVDIERNVSILKRFLGTMMSPMKQYMILPLDLANKPVDQMQIEVRQARFKTLLVLPHSPMGSGCMGSSKTMMPKKWGPEDGGSVGGEVEIRITWRESGYAEIFCVSNTWTIHLLMAALRMPSNTKIAEIGGFGRDYPWSSRKSIAEVGWGERGEVVELYMTDGDDDDDDKTDVEMKADVEMKTEY